MSYLLRKTVRRPFKKFKKITIKKNDPAIPLPVDISGSRVSERYLYTHGHRRTIESSQEV